MSVNIVCFDGNQLLDESNRRLWVDHLLNRYGLKCELLGGQATLCKIVDWQALHGRGERNIGMVG